MEKKYPMPIAELEKTDREFAEAVQKVYDLAMAPGALDARTKILITLVVC